LEDISYFLAIQVLLPSFKLLNGILKLFLVILALVFPWFFRESILCFLSLLEDLFPLTIVLIFIFFPFGLWQFRLLFASHIMLRYRPWRYLCTRVGWRDVIESRPVLAYAFLSGALIVTKRVC
jgi:hypothetical protein